MKRSYRKPLSKGLLIGFVVFTLFLQGNPIPARSGASPSLLSTISGAQVILETPSLTPTYSGMCISGKPGWHRFLNQRGSYAYLTLNEQNAASADRRGEWRPNIPQDGYYLVEAFVPTHPSIDWVDCPQKRIGWDTSNARYTINHGEGQSTVSGNQAPLKDEWLPLGTFPFSAGTSGVVALTDYTAETNQSTTVAFSAMRFTLVSPIYLPFVVDRVSSVRLNSIWTSDAGGAGRDAYLRGEPLRLYSSGSNTSGEKTQANLNWSQDGPCGPRTVFNNTITLGAGTWTDFQASVSPDCLGIYTNTLQLNHFGQTSTLENRFVVNSPSTAILGSQPAFDKCNIPTLSQMQIWWNSSPYSIVNLYIGGSLRTCANSELDAFWIYEASRQGWTFIPTWVGPQAPCSKFRERFSSNANTAYYQGKDEAEAAFNAAHSLGLLGERGIYYDLESFSGATQSCRDTVKAFMRGWTEQLHELGAKAGLYGSSCTSYMSDYATNDPVLDDVWIAYWNRSSYDPNASVFGIPCLSDSLWADHQRIRQYTGGHRETWGGLALTIDSNIADGGVTALLVPGEEARSEIAPEEPVSEQTPGMRDFQMVDPDSGWVRTDQELLWTENGGLNWSAITPQAAGGGPVLGAAFANDRLGWVVASLPGEDMPVVLRTDDRGASWEEARLPVSLETAGAPVQAAYLDFIDAQTGWIALKLASSTNFSLGMLFYTTDGGRIWTERSLPFGEPVRFLDTQRGWVAGGAEGDELFYTADGGLTWSPQPVRPEDGVPPEKFQVGLPEFESDGLTGILPVTVTAPGEPRVDLYTTRDGGASWYLASSIQVDPLAAPGEPAPVARTEGGRWLVAVPGQAGLLSIGAGAGLELNRSSLALPEGALQLEFARPEVGWAQVQEGSCSGEKPASGGEVLSAGGQFRCQTRMALLKTEDGGQSWVEITP